MPAVPFQRTFSRPSNLPPRSWTQPSRRTEIIFWVLTVTCIVGLRWWTASLSTYIWTRDSGSYLTSAVTWLHGGPWVTSARRGPVYSLLMAAVFGAGGTLKTLADIQAILGGATAVITVAAARLWLGRRAFWPLVLCTPFYVCYGMPIELERLIRNETLLVFLATGAFGAWCCALRTGSARWFAASGIFTGTMHLLKGIFPIFPLLVLGIIVWNWRNKPRRAALLAGVFLGLFLLPTVSSKLYSRLSGTTRPPEPEDGQMFYGRTAQWTYLGGDGILPDIKARIHDQAKAYMDRYARTGKLDNNEIVKRTVVPTLKTIIVDERGGTLVEVNRVGWKLGLEAVRHHPGAYFKQFTRDLRFLNLRCAHKMPLFEPRQFKNSYRDAQIYVKAQGKNEPLTARIFDLENSRAALEKAADRRSALQRCGHFIKDVGHLRLVSPVLLTTLLLPLLTWLVAGRQRLFWLGNLVLWFYYLILLSTVGRPLDRYLMPVVPLMFWTITTAAALAWQRCLAWRSRSLPAAG